MESDHQRLRQLASAEAASRNTTVNVLSAYSQPDSQCTNLSSAWQTIADNIRTVTDGIDAFTVII